ncbi:MAG: hypothetical protein A2831_01140 [Candidatus Yanofskybacteria bacterium RIFCSPHIGHO2_01_FULL_44_17]|uniref:Uncharacterized protein n=1 Tax=Candidatus Yanofskybacteria bacterium RIFCSPHIGHO2_01_FULL_44_17 TaxID=1802668 RepID=A0A1F8ETW4_9BACT|nr:MAG: hypothetical protein A2831_01140 [Candidatus Yanofskybacteria bacterium RIFCSPHIGHO2_01_FULL_44_17]
MPFNFSRMSHEEVLDFLSCNKRKTFKFWYDQVCFVVPNDVKIGGQIHYVARFLTAFSLKSAPLGVYFPTLPRLMIAYRSLMSDVDFASNPKKMEIAACSALLLGGFYFHDTAASYNLADIEKTGRSLFMKSAVGRRKKVLVEMGKNFRAWQNLLAYLNWHLHEEKFLINVPRPIGPLIKITGG